MSVRSMRLLSIVMVYPSHPPALARGVGAGPWLSGGYLGWVGAIKECPPEFAERIFALPRKSMSYRTESPKDSTGHRKDGLMLLSPRRWIVAVLWPAISKPRL